MRATGLFFICIIVSCAIFCCTAKHIYEDEEEMDADTFSIVRFYYNFMDYMPGMRISN